MKWEDRGRSRNLEDRRGRRPVAATGASLGIGGIVIVLLFSLLTGTDLTSILGTGGSQQQQQSVPGPGAGLEGEEEMVRFVSFVLDDVQEMWTDIFDRSGLEYPEARLVLFRGAVNSACGNASSAMGPFYCSGDENAYIDLSFYDDLRDRYGADGDFAQAYVLAHELGHHVQHVLGTMGEVSSLQRSSPQAANRLSVALELQADCYAGIWASSAESRGLMEPGDLEEGLGAAASVGDDRLRGRAGGQVNPESFTHGTSAQRMQWFRTGFRTGDPNACDTFAGL